jgi:hypothetical protein
MKNKSTSSNPRRNLELTFLLIVLLVLALPLAGCSVAGEPQDNYYPSQDFSVTFLTNEGQIEASLLVTNLGDSAVPADNEFGGRTMVWDKDGKSIFRVDSLYLAQIGPGESREVTKLKWSLEPGIYFLAWGSPNYGGVLTSFIVELLSSGPEVVRSQSFETKPEDLGGDYRNCGMVKDFSLAEDGSLFLAGESPLPDESCLYPLLYSEEGLVDGFPFGECAQIADGQWHLEVPADPGSERIYLEEDTSYRVIVFSEDIRIDPSEPFEVLISPPVSE